MASTTQHTKIPRPAGTTSFAGGGLEAVLHCHRFAAVLDQAVVIRDWPCGSERDEEAAKLIRHALVLCTLGQISQAEESQVFTILSFAMPNDAWSEP